MSGVAPGGFFKLPESGRINKGAVGSRYSNRAVSDSINVSTISYEVGNKDS